MRRCFAAETPSNAPTEAEPLSPSLRVEWAARWAATSLAMAMPPAAPEEAPRSAGFAAEKASVALEVAAAKASLLRLVASLDRGAAASPSDRVAVDSAVAALERASRGVPQLNAAAAGGAPRLEEAFSETLSGLWRLVYSSTFAGEGPGSQGFTGAPGAGTPLRLLGVFQRISTRRRTLDNIVELRVPAPFPLPGGVTVVATLAHSLEATGETGVRIEFTEVQLRLRGVKGARPLALPSPLKALGIDAALPASLRGGAFDTTFLDGEARISRGDRGETRVFVRA